MEYLFDKASILSELKKSQKTLLFLDYDGVLAKFVANPEKAFLPLKNKSMLKKLSTNKFFTVSIITGRPLKQIKSLIGLKNILYVGNHGLEIGEIPLNPELNDKFDNKKIFKNNEIKKVKEILASVKKEISKATEKIRGAYIEDKGITLSLHWRDVDEKDKIKILKIIREIKRKYKNILKFMKGKKVINLLPSLDWNKGKALELLLEKVFLRKKYIIVYIGDDVTDEYAFRVLEKNGITIRVGKKKNSYAKYYLKNINEVYKFLLYLERL